MPQSLDDLLTEIRGCRACGDLPLGPRPVVQADARAPLLVVGQAPGRRVHASGIPFDDPSGDRLRTWLGIDRATFYDPTRLAIVPMGFCYPGKGRAGDLPPRAECAPLWRERLLAHLPAVQTTLVIGAYAHAWHLPDLGGSLTDRVRNWRDVAPARFPLPHPSPRNTLWLRRNLWFEAEVVPALREHVASLLAP